MVKGNANLPLFVIVGVAYGALITFRDLNQLLIFTALATLLALFYWRSQYRILFVAVSATLALVTAHYSLWLYRVNQINLPITAEVEGTVCGIPRGDQHFVRFDFCVAKVDGRTLKPWFRPKLRLSWREYTGKRQLPELSAGKYVTLLVKLKPIHGRLNPGAFDYQKWLFSHGYHAQGYVKRLIPEPAQRPISSYLSIRARMIKKVEQALAAYQYRGYLLALTLGDTSALPAELKQAIRESGTAHLLVVSGLHIGMIALWGYVLSAWLWRRSAFLCRCISAKSAGMFGGISAAILLGYLSGFELPAVRAITMLVLFVLIRSTGLTTNLLSLLLATASLFVLFDPFALLTASFWLSFVAVALIALLMYEKRSENTQLAKVKSWLMFNARLYMALIPLTLAIFLRFNWLGVVANWLLVPIATLMALPLAVLSVVVALSGRPVPEALLDVLSLAFNLMQWLQLKIGQSNYLYHLVEADQLWILLLFLILTLLVLLPARLIPGASRKVFIFLSALLLFIHAGYSVTTTPVLTMTILDVGQGQAVHIKTRSHHLLYDTGYGNREFSISQSTLLPYFEYAGVKQLDAVVLSHGDADHAGGKDDLMKWGRVRRWYSGEPLRTGIGEPCQQAKPWAWDGVTFQFSSINVGLKGNNASCILQITAAKHHLLLTGDIESRVEHKLVQLYQQQPLLITAPHHGSLSSSSEEFVDMLKPSWVVFSTGFVNQWKFPRPEILSRYLRIHANLHDTGSQGYIRLHIYQSGRFLIERPGATRRHLWQYTKPHISY